MRSPLLTVAAVVMTFALPSAPASAATFINDSAFQGTANIDVFCGLDGDDFFAGMDGDDYLYGDDCASRLGAASAQTSDAAPTQSNEPQAQTTIPDGPGAARHDGAGAEDARPAWP